MKPVSQSSALVALEFTLASAGHEETVSLSDGTEPKKHPTPLMDTQPAGPDLSWSGAAPSLMGSQASAPALLRSTSTLFFNIGIDFGAWKRV